MEKGGIEPPMFTTWEQIYSLPQHRQSLPLFQKTNTIKISLYSSYLQPYSVDVTISLSVWVRPSASYRCQARTGLIPINFTVRSEFFCAKKYFLLLPYRYFNEFLVLYSGFPDSRQADLMKFLSVRSLSHHEL